MLSSVVDKLRRRWFKVSRFTVNQQLGFANVRDILVQHPAKPNPASHVTLWEKWIIYCIGRYIIHQAQRIRWWIGQKGGDVKCREREWKEIWQESHWHQEERVKKKAKGQQQEVGVDGGGFEWFGLRVFTEKPWLFSCPVSSYKSGNISHPSKLYCMKCCILQSYERGTHTRIKWGE